MGRCQSGLSSACRVMAVVDMSRLKEHSKLDNCVGYRCQMVAFAFRGRRPRAVLCTGNVLVPNPH